MCSQEPSYLLFLQLIYFLEQCSSQIRVIKYVTDFSMVLKVLESGAFVSAGHLGISPCRSFLCHFIRFYIEIINIYIKIQKLSQRTVAYRPDKQFDDTTTLRIYSHLTGKCLPDTIYIVSTDCMNFVCKYQKNTVIVLSWSRPGIIIFHIQQNCML